MGFPIWTLYGMGASALAALLAVGLAYLAQSPASARRLGLEGLRLDRRVHGLTGWGLAFILLAIGFFAAGVPLEGQEPAAALEEEVAGDGEQESAAAPAAGDADEDAALPDVATPTLPQVSSGAMGSVPPEDTPESDGAQPESTPTSPVSSTTATTEAAEEEPADEPAVASSSPSATPEPTTAATPTPTATPPPTQTPTPTVTPTPLSGETAVIDTSGSTLWVRRSPGGQELALVRDGDVVLLHDGRANQAGILWREVSTLDGVRGWVQDEFLQ